MAAPALAPDRVQSATTISPRLDYKRGSCPRCQQPMLVLASKPDAPCIDCFVQTEAPNAMAVGTKPIPVVK